MLLVAKGCKVIKKRAKQYYAGQVIGAGEVASAGFSGPGLPG